MALGALAAGAAGPVVREVKETLKHPVIGIKRTVVKHSARRDTTTTTSFELRGWELAALAAVAALAYGAYVGNAWIESVLPKKDTITLPGGKTVNNPIANIPVVGSVFAQLAGLKP